MNALNRYMIIGLLLSGSLNSYAMQEKPLEVFPSKMYQPLTLTPRAPQYASAEEDKKLGIDEEEGFTDYEKIARRKELRRTALEVGVITFVNSVAGAMSYWLNSDGLAGYIGIPTGAALALMTQQYPYWVKMLCSSVALSVEIVLSFTCPQLYFLVNQYTALTLVYITTTTINDYLRKTGRTLPLSDLWSNVQETVRTKFSGITKDLTKKIKGLPAEEQEAVLYAEVHALMQQLNAK